MAYCAYGTLKFLVLLRKLLILPVLSPFQNDIVPEVVGFVYVQVTDCSWYCTARSIPFARYCVQPCYVAGTRHDFFFYDDTTTTNETTPFFFVRQLLVVVSMEAPKNQKVSKV